MNARAPAVFFGVVLFVAATAFAGPPKWESIGEGSDGRTYSLAVKAKKGEVLQVLWAENDRERERGEVTDMEFRCSSWSMRRTNPPSSWEVAAPGTVAHRALEHLCGESVASAAPKDPTDEAARVPPGLKWHRSKDLPGGEYGYDVTEQLANGYRVTVFVRELKTEKVKSVPVVYRCKDGMYSGEDSDSPWKPAKDTPLQAVIFIAVCAPTK